MWRAQTKRNRPINVPCHRDPISISTSGNVSAGQPGGKRVKTVPAIKANFLSLFKSLCVHSSANFTSELVCSKEGGKDREQKGRQEFSSRSLPFTVGQRTVLKWIPIFQGVDLIKRGPDFRDGNILPGRKLRKFGARNIKAVWPKADG